MKSIMPRLLSFLFLISASAFAGPPGGNGSGLTLSASAPPFANLSNVVGTTINSDVEIREAGATQIAATYRLIAGLNQLSFGKTFSVRWQDGSKEASE